MNKQGLLLREVREKYKLTQKDLAGGIMDRSLITHIENGTLKYPLLEETAIKIADNINEKIKDICEEKLDYLYFYNHEKFELIQGIREKILLLENLLLTNNFNAFDEEFEKLTIIFIKNNVPEVKLKAFELAGHNAIKQRNYFKAYTFFTRAIDNAIVLGNINQLIELSSQSARVLIYLNNYDEALTIYKFLFSTYDDEISEELAFKLHYNSGHALNEQKKYELALVEFKNALKLLDKSNKKYFVELYSSISICYSRQNLFKDAINILEIGLSEINCDTNITLPLNLNKLSIYVSTRDNSNITKYIDIIQAQLNSLNKDSKYFSHGYQELANAFIVLGDIPLAEMLLFKALGISKTINDTYGQIISISRLLEQYSLSKNSMKINVLVSEIYQLINGSEYNLDELIRQLIYALLEVGECETIKSLLNFIKKEKEEKNEKENNNFIIDSSYDAISKYKHNC